MEKTMKITHKHSKPEINGILVTVILLAQSNAVLISSYFSTYCTCNHYIYMCINYANYATVLYNQWIHTFHVCVTECECAWLFTSL